MNNGMDGEQMYWLHVIQLLRMYLKMLLLMCLVHIMEEKPAG